MIDLQTAFYLVIGLSMVMYAVLDGFDLGVGALHLFAKNDEQRRLFINAIGPVWDGNEVWIVVVMGGLFAGFPNVYATVFSGFYTLLMILIAGLMFRPCGIEFRSKLESRGWRQFWDVVFCLSSLLVSFIIGVLLGNLIMGMPLNANQEYVGTFGDFFDPYTISTGILAIALFAMHGAIYLHMKLDGAAQEVVRRWINPAIAFFLVSFAITTAATLIYIPRMTDPFREHLALWLVPIAAFAAILNIPYQVQKRNDGWAFLSSCASIFLLLCLFHIGNFPNMIISTIDPATNNLTIYNTSSSQETLTLLLIVVAIGAPLVLGYGFWVYRTFRGKVRLDYSSY